MASHQHYMKMTSNDDIGGPMAQIANWITSPPLNVSRIKFLLHSPPSYFLSPLIPPSGQIQRPKSQPRLVLSLSPHPHHLTSH